MRAIWRRREHHRPMGNLQRLRGATRYRPHLEVLEDRTLWSFITTASYATGASPDAVVAADLRGNGRQDLVVADAPPGVPGTVNILLGNGDGTFQSPISYGVGIQPASVAVGDFDGDGTLDIAVANQGSNTVSILQGNGDGTFRPPVSYAVISGPDSLVAGDFRGNGILDLAVAVYNSNTVSVLLGNGDGTFQAATSYAVGSNPVSLAEGDFDGDGTPDLVVLNKGSNSVSVLLDNGDGTFQPATNYSVGAFPGSVVVGDFNGDGVPDLAVTIRNPLRRRCVGGQRGRHLPGRHQLDDQHRSGIRGRGRL
jgi:hypothetical protein